MFGNLGWSHQGDQIDKEKEVEIGVVKLGAGEFSCIIRIGSEFSVIFVFKFWII